MNAVAAPFKSSDFRKLFVGQLISGFGDWLATFAFISLVYALTGSSAQVAILLVVRLLPPMFAAPIGGILADRWPRRPLMVGADLVRAGIIALVPFVGLWQVYLIAFLHEFVSLFFLPPRDAVIPEITPKESLEVANGLMFATAYALLPVAGAVFGALHSAGGVYPHTFPLSGRINTYPETLAFFADAVTFVASALFIANMSLSAEQRRIEGRHPASLKEDMLGELRAVWYDHKIRSLLYGIAVSTLGAGVLFVVGIGYVRQTLHASSTTFGWLTSLWGIGMVIGLLLVRWLVQQRGRRYVYVADLLLLGGVLIGMAIVPLKIIAFALAIPFGAAFATVLALAITMAQASSGEDTRGRVMGGVQTVLRVGVGVGALTIGLLASKLTHVSFLGVTLDGNQFGMLVSGIVVVIGGITTLKTLP